MALIRRRELKRTKIEIIPMIDTMFFLLVFFILASLNIVDVKGTTVDLPDSKNQDKQMPSKLAVTIKSNGAVTINKSIPVNPGDDVGDILLEQLTQSSAQDGSPLQPQDAVVVINADRRAEYAWVRRCIDDARKKKFVKFSIATDPKLYGG